MKILTDHVDPAEKAYGIYEGPAMVEGQNHWVQDVTVIRADRRAHFVKDFGPAENFEHVTPIMMPSMGEDSVAELQFWCEKNRHDSYWYKRSLELQEGSTLVADHVRQIEQFRELIANRSVFGPRIKVQRDGYPHETVMRDYRERRDKARGWKNF